MSLSYPDPPLGDAVVLLRPWHEGDLDCVRRAASDPAIPAGTSVPSPYDERAGLAYLHRQQRRLVDGEGVSLAVADAGTDRAVGMVWLAPRPQQGVWGIGYWLAPDARGRGRGARAVGLATQWLLGVLGAARVEAWVEPGNTASLRLLATAGFRSEGVLRSYLVVGERRADAVVLSRTQDDLA